MNASEYRQQVAAFRNRLTEFAIGNVPQGKRICIDTTGSRSQVVPSSSDIHRLAIYGRRRYISVARVMTLLEILRDAENLHQKYQTIRVEAKGAYWQAFRGTRDIPACHTCPALLMLNGQLPVLATSNIGLRRHIIIVFADCMLMPNIINKVDRYFDDSLAWTAFERAAYHVLNDADVAWSNGLEICMSEIRVIFGDMIRILDRDYHFSDDESQKLFMACQALYEGLFLTQEPLVEINNYVSEVTNEMIMH